VVSALTLAPGEAHAEGPVSPTGKGIAGGALLGGEVVMITTAIIGVKAWWPYLVFGAVGAGGGAVGGYFVERVNDGLTPEPSLYLLAGGLALVIPTVVAVLNVTAYDPEDDEEAIDEDEEDGEETTPGVDVDVNAGGQTGMRRPIPMALMGIDLFNERASVSPGIPAVAVTPMYSPREIATFGVEQETVVRIPLITGAF
jgi:hypothetical protein